METEHSVVSETMVLWEALILFISLALFISGNFIFLILMKYYESIPFINRNTVTYLSMYLICILVTIIIVAVIKFTQLDNSNGFGNKEAYDRKSNLTFLNFGGFGGSLKVCHFTHFFKFAYMGKFR